MSKIEQIIQTALDWYDKKRKEVKENIHPVLFIVLDSLMVVLICFAIMILVGVVCCLVLLVFGLFIVSLIKVGEGWGEFGFLGLLILYIWIAMVGFKLKDYYKEKRKKDNE